MPQVAKIWSISGLATELGKDSRTISRALRRVPEDGKADKAGHPGWFMSTALKALNASPRGESNDSGIEAALDDLERVSGELEHDIARLAAEPDVEKRRAMVEQFGHKVGELDRAFEATMTEETRSVFRPLQDQVVGSAMREILQLCEWTLAPEAA
jgi:hypothetical protein